jgi:hypothetical protein
MAAIKNLSPSFINWSSPKSYRVVVVVVAVVVKYQAGSV